MMYQLVCNKHEYVKVGMTCTINGKTAGIEKQSWCQCRFCGKVKKPKNENKTTLINSQLK